MREMTARNSRTVMTLLAVALVLATGYVAWHAYAVERTRAETARHQVLWHTGQALAAFAQVNQAVADGGETAVRLETFDASVAQLRGPEFDATIRRRAELNALSQRLEQALAVSKTLLPVTAGYQAREVSRQLSDELVELLRISALAGQYAMLPRGIR